MGYYKGSVGAFIVFDISKKETFTNVEKWFQDLKYSANDKITIILIGNKSDLNSQREVSQEDAKSLARTMEAMYVETSAKLGTNIDQCFECLTKEILRKIYAKEIDLEDNTIGVKVNRVTLDAGKPLAGADSCKC